MSVEFIRKAERCAGGLLSYTMCCIVDMHKTALSNDMKTMRALNPVLNCIIITKRCQRKIRSRIHLEIMFAPDMHAHPAIFPLIHMNPGSCPAIKWRSTRLNISQLIVQAPYPVSESGRHNGEGVEAHPHRVLFLYFTSTVLDSEYPNTSGSYIISAFVLGSAYVPKWSARTKYVKRCSPAFSTSAKSRTLSL